MPSVVDGGQLIQVPGLIYWMIDTGSPMIINSLQSAPPISSKNLRCNSEIKDFSYQVVERRKQIEIEDQEIKRKEKELMATVRLPAEAEAYKVQTVAEGMR